MRHLFISILIVVLSWIPNPTALASISENSAPAPSRPDVLFIIVDDLNDWNSLLEPNAPIQTPNLERLAHRGTLFTHAYCASPACNPSRVATLTGLRPTTSGVYGNKSDWRRALPDRPTLMQRFRDAGYHVRGAGKIFHHHLNGAFHDDDSFDDFQPMRPQLYPSEKLNQAPEYGSKNTDWGVWPPDEDFAIDTQTVDYAIQALQNPPKDRPQFLAVGLFKPHSPFFAPKIYHKTVADIPLPPRAPNDWDDLPSGARSLLSGKKWFWNGMQSLDQRLPGSYHDFIRAYAACVAFTDANIGRLIDALETSPRGDSAIIILWSDHGFHLGEKDHIEKFALWEKATHVPLIISAPGVTHPGARCSAPVDLMALYPTALDLCGLPPDPIADGTSLRPLLENPDHHWDIPAVSTYGRGNHSVRSGDWRYIQYSDQSEELYNLETDPHEWTNLARDPDYLALTKELRRFIPKDERPQVADLKKPRVHSMPR